MATIYDKGDTEIQTRVLAVLAEYFADLLEAKVQIKILFAQSDEPPALRHQGYGAAATIRINNLKERTLGNGDALLIIDKKNYDDLSERQRDGLVHHELHHLIVKRDKESDEIVRDDKGRPRLSMRKHDIQHGWFLATARIFGKDSPEVMQARQMIELGGELVFPFMVDKPMNLLLPDRKKQAKEREEAEAKAAADAEKGEQKKPVKKRGKKKAKAEELELVK